MILQGEPNSSSNTYTKKWGCWNVLDIVGYVKMSWNDHWQMGAHSICRHISSYIHTQILQNPRNTSTCCLYHVVICQVMCTATCPKASTPSRCCKNICSSLRACTFLDSGEYWSSSPMSSAWSESNASMASSGWDCSSSSHCSSSASPSSPSPSLLAPSRSCTSASSSILGILNRASELLKTLSRSPLPGLTHVLFS